MMACKHHDTKEFDKEKSQPPQYQFCVPDHVVNCGQQQWSAVEAGKSPRKSSPIC